MSQGHVRIFQDNAALWRFSATQRPGNKADFTSGTVYVSRNEARDAAEAFLGEEFDAAFIFIDGQSDMRHGTLPPLPTVDRKQELIDAGFGIEE